jgi:hypothetical protein
VKLLWKGWTSFAVKLIVFILLAEALGNAYYGNWIRAIFGLLMTVIFCEVFE